MLAMKRGVLMAVLGAGILAVFSFRGVKNTGVSPRLAEVGACSIGSGDCGNFTETCRTSSDKFTEWRRTWSKYSPTTIPSAKKTESSKEVDKAKKEAEKVSEISHALEWF